MHGVDVRRIGGAPKRRRAFGVFEAAVPIAAVGIGHVPREAGQPRVRIRARFQERLRQVEIGRVLKVLLLRLRERVRGCHFALTAAQSGATPLSFAATFGSAPRFSRRSARSYCPLMVAMRSGLVPSPALNLIDVRITFEKRHDRFGVTLTCGMQKGSQAAFALQDHARTEAALVRDPPRRSRGARPRDRDRGPRRSPLGTGSRSG